MVTIFRVQAVLLTVATCCLLVAALALTYSVLSRPSYVDTFSAGYTPLSLIQQANAEAGRHHQP